ncbi:MAG: peptide chain release factor N(5)-glutamine methyltransferase [Candidatus Omnitrophica bacterium]|nr:peptide chain release factor N(5)-glutamine methyltransferase [Candidatus Omnitrophota bacterium]
MNQAKTLNELWSEGAAFLEDWGLEDARWECRLLLSKLLGLDGVNFLLGLHRPVSDPPTDRLHELLERRKQGEPLQYLIGTVNFMGFEFEVTPDVFIPRPETEILVESLIGRVRLKARDDVSTAIHVLDIGSGCGNIGLSVARLVPQVTVTMMDVSRGAIEVAKRNAVRLGVSQRTHFVEQDVRRGVPLNEGPFDYVVSNPPYIRRNEIPRLMPEVRREPRMALDGGDDGLDFYRVIIERTLPSLNTGGCLAGEIGWGQARAVVKLLALTKGFYRIEVIKDYNGIERVVIAHKI